MPHDRFEKADVPLQFQSGFGIKGHIQEHILAFALFADMALRPTFPPDELERKRKERLTRLVEWHDQPGAINSVAFNGILFGKDHPYGRTSVGNERSLRALRISDLKEFYGKYFHAKNATFVVVGDVVPSAMIAKLEGFFGSWKGGDAASITLPVAAQVRENRIYLIDKPGSAQSVMSAGHVSWMAGQPQSSSAIGFVQPGSKTAARSCDWKAPPSLRRANLVPPLEGLPAMQSVVQYWMG